MKHKIYIGQNLKEYEEVERKIEIDGEEFQIQEKREDIIELSSHEVIGVNILYPLREESNGAKFRNELRIEIEGKMQTNKNNSSEVVGLYEQEGKGEVIPIDNFELDINGHKFNDMMFQVRFGRAQINGGVLDRQEKTFKINHSDFFGTNALKLKKWTLDYLSDTDYRDMILAVIYHENDIRVTRYSNLYVVDYKEFFSVKEGVPRFKIVLGQKYEEKKKEEVKEKNSVKNLKENLLKDSKESYVAYFTFYISDGILEVKTNAGDIFEIEASSGKDEYLNNSSIESQKASFKGVLPVGKYLIIPSEFSDPKVVKDFFRNINGDWGDWRIRLHNLNEKKSEFHGRNNFFLHGGWKKGSAGCIDIGGGIFGNKNTDKIRNIIINSKTNILLSVKE